MHHKTQAFEGVHSEGPWCWSWDQVALYHLAETQEEERGAAANFSTRLLMYLFPYQGSSLAGGITEEPLGLEHLLASCQHCEIKEKLDKARFSPNIFCFFKGALRHLPTYLGSQNLKRQEYSSHLQINNQVTTEKVPGM